LFNKLSKKYPVVFFLLILLLILKVFLCETGLRVAHTINIKFVPTKKNTELAASAFNFTTNPIQWGAFYLFVADFFATQIIGGAKELVVLLRLSGGI